MPRKCHIYNLTQCSRVSRVRDTQFCEMLSGRIFLVSIEKHFNETIVLFFVVTLTTINCCQDQRWTTKKFHKEE